MSVSRHCPVCGSYALAFEAAAKPRDNDVIAVVGRCQHCKYKFRHDFDFEEMHSEHVVDEGSEKDSDFRPMDVEGNNGKRESAVQQHARWLGQDRQPPGGPYDPGRVSTPDNEGPPDD